MGQVMEPLRRRLADWLVPGISSPPSAEEGGPGLPSPSPATSHLAKIRARRAADLTATYPLAETRRLTEEMLGRPTVHLEDRTITLGANDPFPLVERVWEARRAITRCPNDSVDGLCRVCQERVVAIEALENA